MGATSFLEKKFGGPTITKDGVTVAKEIELRSPLEGLAIIRRCGRRHPLRNRDHCIRGKALMEPAGEIVIGSVDLPVRAKLMKRINFSVTIDELRLLASLASDQLFRRQFIDPKMPGYKGDPEEVDVGKALVRRMLLIIDGGTPPYHISPRAASSK